MITVRHGVFHLQNEHSSYLFRVRDGLLEHVYFGAGVSSVDAGALAVRPGCGWGDSTLYKEGSNAACLDILPLEWSGCGRGDYRESPLELSQGGVPISTDFRFAGCEALPAPPACVLPVSRGQSVLAVYLEDSAAKLRLTLLYGVLPTAFTRRAVLENLGQSPVYIRKMMSACTELPGELTLHSFSGGWIAEMQHTVTPVTMTRAGIESTTGGSSSRANPGFLLAEPDATETGGGVYGFNLLYSGSHVYTAQKSLQGLTRVLQGISPVNFDWELAPGDRFETPEAVMAYSADGFGGLSGCMHRYVHDALIPPYWKNRPRPIVYNSWEGCMFDFTETKLLRLGKTAAQLGCELFVLDDGWFGKRSSDTCSLGDYTVNEKKLPNGLKGLGEKLNAMGLQFGLWFEPESVSPDSDLYRAHPDWALHDPLGREELLGRHQLLLDLTKPEVRDYIVENVGKVLDSAPISYVKWDMNRHSCALGAKQHAFVLGLYDVLRRIFVPRPEILLESCSSGGNRFDCGMLWFSPQIWCSDNTDPVERMRIQQSLSYLYPPSAFGAHVSASPHAQTLRATPLSTRGNVSLFGCLGYELDLTELLPVEQAEIKAQIEFYKAHRLTLQYGRFTRGRTDGGGIVWQMQTGKETVAGVFHGVQPAAPGYERLRVTGLDAAKRYRMESRPQLLRVGEFGTLLRHVLPVKLNANGFAVRAADSYYRMYDGAQSVTASGAAYGAGIMLAPRFAGTGYDPDGRMQSDFGSNIYFIREVCSHEKP